MNRRHFLAVFGLVLIGMARSVPAAAPRTLTTEFTYTATVAAPTTGTLALDVWLPVPTDGPFQTVRRLTVTAPGAYQITREPRFGNGMVFLHLRHPEGVTQVTVRFTVARREVRGLDQSPVALTAPASLSPDARVPVGGRFRRLADAQTQGAATTQSKERALFDHVVRTMTYDYKKASPEYAQGDAAFVCDYKSGNCSDLHSYLISLSRSEDIPAFLEFGFPLSGIPVTAPLPTDGEIKGYHCWMWFQDGRRGWVPLDAADSRRWTDAGQLKTAHELFGGLVLERSPVAVSRGRDLTLSPPQKAGPLNYFIYPYAEADGLPTPAGWELRYHVISNTC